MPTPPPDAPPPPTGQGRQDPTDTPDPDTPDATHLPDAVRECSRQLEQAREEAARANQEARRAKEDAARDAAELRSQQAALSQEQAALAKRAAHLKTAAQAIAERQAELAIEERRLEELRTEARLGFHRENQAALATLREERDRLAAEIEAESAKLAEHRALSLQRIATESEAARATAEADLEREVAQRRARLDEELDATREAHEARLGAQQQALDSLAKSLQEGEGTLAKQQAELAAAQQRLMNDRAVLEEDRRSVEGRLGALRDRLEAECEGNRRADRHTIDALRSDRARLEATVGRLNDLLTRFGSDDPALILDRQRELEATSERLREELAQRPGPEAIQQLHELRAEQRDWVQQRTQLHAELENLKGSQARWLSGVGELERERDLRETEETRRKALQASTAHLEKEVDRLAGMLSPKAQESRLSIIETPIFKGNELPTGAAEPVSEGAWLDAIADGCSNSGFVFPHRLLKAFHTALKTAAWSPLTVLAGVSGTGKSALPQLYARFGGLLSQTIPVQPNWDSPQSLWGYFNSIDNLYNATPLLRALTQMSRSEGPDALDDRVLLVLLDEMNLAHVELYFSDLLSKLEERRGADRVALDIDLGAGAERYQVELDTNVLWVGTMNEDETTKSLSDKVLDRGHLINFPRPQHLKRRTSTALQDPSELLPRSYWEDWIVDESNLTAETVAPYVSALEEINTRLETVGRALGHRVWQAIEQYIANHPDVRATADAGDDPPYQAAVRRAFEDAVVQKVMPKLRGIETAGNARSKCLDPILQILEGLDLNLTDDFNLATRGSYGAFVWKSARYLVPQDRAPVGA